MLTYFHKNKLNYKKGQLAPFFILILVVLIVMAMVTVNLSKVAFIKTDSSNAVDSGALAAGSVMANVFNAVASANSQMETLYWEFLGLVSISFTYALIISLPLAYTSATSALASATSAAEIACSSPCGAVGLATEAVTSTTTALSWLTEFIRTTRGIIASVTAFSIMQYHFYLSIRDMAEKGRLQGIAIGHRLAFINSGIGSKLKEGSPPEEITEQEQKNNYRNEFSRFLDEEIGVKEDKTIIAVNAEYTYPWEDGQHRKHYVRVRVDIDPVDTFNLRVAVLPTALELAFLGTSLYPLASDAQTALTAAKASYEAAVTALISACECYEQYVLCIGCCPGCGPKCPHCCDCCRCAATNLACWNANCELAEMELASGIKANSAAISSMTAIFPLMAFAWAGLLSGPIITDSDGFRAFLPFIIPPYIICWIDDIMDPNNPDEPHNRLVRVETWQAHQGEDYGMWRTKYPAEWNPIVHPEPLPNECIESYSIVNFTGRGRIHASSLDDLRHDASIIETDRIGSGSGTP